MKVLIVDDHALVRRGMAHVVRESFADAEVVEAGNASEAVALMASTPGVDVALVDVRMPDTDGLDLLHDMKERWPDVPVIMLTSFDHAHYVRRALAEGAAGYMLKDATPEDLEQAIKVAMSGGGNVLSPRVIQNLFEGTSGGATGDSGDAPPRTAGSLTQRETDILALLAEGKSNRAIGQSLFITESTVKSHLKSLFVKLDVTSRAEAIALAAKRGLIKF